VLSHSHINDYVSLFCSAYFRD